MTVNAEQVQHLQRLTLAELRMRQALADKIAEEARGADDPRWQHVQAQADTLQAAIDMKMETLGGKPEPVVIGMAPARLRVRRALIS